MSSPATTAPLPNKRYKMQLLQDEYMVNISGNDGRFPAGAVLLADEETAVRWYERGVADIAPADAEVYGEIVRRNKREEFLKRAQATEGVFDQAVTRASFRDDPNNRQLMPPPMPTRRARGRADLAGAEIVTDPTEDED
jgi:hypothetical protein